MAFKSIGTLAGDVLVKAKAARANQVALKFGAPHLTRREAEGGEALAQSALEPDAQLLNGEGSVSNGNKLAGRDGDHARPGSDGFPASTIASRSMTITASARPGTRLPPASAVVVIDMLAWKERHAALRSMTGTSMRSRNS